jgi:hypothetical protein
MTGSPQRSADETLSAARPRAGRKRGLLTCATVSALFAAYFVYTATIGPLTRPHVLPDEHRGPAAAPEIKPLSITGRMAGVHLTDHDWVASAKYQLQRGEETFIYFHSQRRIDDDRQNKMRVTPFAMVWKDPKSQTDAAYTLSCDSAVIEFDSKVQLGMTGRIIGGRLEGKVRLAGPDGLEIEGRNFLFEEQALRLHSDNPIQFRYGPRPGQFEQVLGRAERIDVTLEDASESVLGHDMPRVGGLLRIELGRNVGLNLVMDNGGKPSPVQVLCKTKLVYDLKQMIATFFDDVKVRRLTSDPGTPEMFDWLECDHLQLLFREAGGGPPQMAAADSLPGEIVPVSASTSGQRRDDALGISLDLEFEQLSAIGSNLKVGSEENQLTARMERLFYNAIEHTVEMQHSAGDVEARYRSDILTCPIVRLWHTAEGDIHSAECRGPGSIVRHDVRTTEAQLEATWQEYLTLMADPQAGLDVLEISGEGHVLQPLQKTGIVADTLRVWLDGQALQSADGNLQASLVGADDAAGLPIKRVQASTNVALVSPRMHLETQSLEVSFVAGAVTNPMTERSSAAQTGSAPQRGDQEQPVMVAADSVTARLVIDPATQTTDVLQLNATDGVTISRARGAAGAGKQSSSDPFAIEAGKLELRNRNGSHVLRLLGTPARIRHPEAEIEGNEMYFDRTGNLAMVEGAGALFVWVNTNLEGEPLEVPEKLLVRWNEQMRFDGRQADFLGDVRATLEDSKMLCQRMMIGLDRKLDLSQQAARTQDLEISRIECHEGVQGFYTEYQRHPVRMTATRHLQLANFTFDCRSGAIHAQGPGQIDDWQLAGQRRRIRLDPAAVTPTEESAVEPSPSWEYTRINFQGEMTGNQHDRYVTLNDRVRVMHGPVERALAVIRRDDFDLETPQAKNSIWIGSDTLQVRLVSGADGTPDTVSALAKGNAELLGKVVGARAHSISYDEANEMFTLKGLGSEAYLWHQERPGGSYRDTLARTIQFVPSRYEITVDGVRGIQGSQ